VQSEATEHFEIAAAIVRRHSPQRNRIDFEHHVSQIRNANRPFVGYSNVSSVDEAVEKRWISG
jgi:hypothetical protein